MNTKPISAGKQAASCYFRTSVEKPHRKALIQIDERCNLHCVHCFVSATRRGSSMPLGAVEDMLVPRLSECRVTRVTLTGGEPTIHPDFLAVVQSFRRAQMDVGVCTNGTDLDDDCIASLAEVGGVHVNVSLDGFRPESHGMFRGNRESFLQTVDTVQRLSRAGLLQGLLCTPNNLAEEEEYRKLCEFAVDQGACYVLMNPLGSMGRGVKSQSRLAQSEEHMQRIYELTAPFEASGLEVVHIRFPDAEGAPLAGCEAGTIIYVFTPGEVTVCPYLVFAARTPQSKHDPKEFIVGNIFTDRDIAARLDSYSFHDRYQVGANPTCGACALESSCGKGCPAAVISSGERIGAVDAAVCPVTTGRRRLPVVTA
jgi:radical SAM protein with 4Fe4S-binding SPASM domain